MIASNCGNVQIGQDLTIDRTVNERLQVTVW